MKRRILSLGIGLLFLIVISSSAMAAYTAGDTVTLRLPESGFGTSVIIKPKFFRYTLFDPANNVVYEEDHEMVYLHDLGFGLGWSFYDEYYVRIPAFPSEGTWTLQGWLFSEAGFIELPDVFVTKKTFTVESTDFMTNLLAPSYFTIDMGFTAGRINLATPVSIHLIIIFIVLAIVILFLVRYLISTPGHMAQGDKHEKKKNKS